MPGRYVVQAVHDLRDPAGELLDELLALRQVARAMAEDWEWVSLRAALEQMARDNSVQGILARQRETMDFILRPVPASQELYAAETALRSQFPATPEQAAEVQQAVSKVTASLRKRKIVERISRAFKEVDLAGLTPWGVLVLVTWFLLRLASEPGQTPSNDLVVISIVIAVGADIIECRVGDRLAAEESN